MNALQKVAMDRPMWHAGLLAVMMIFCVLNASGATYYVAPGGDDSHGGTAGWSDALRTISNALFQAHNTDTVLVSNGVYTLTASLAVTNQITLRSWNNGALDYANTIINGNGAGRCLFASNDSTALPMIAGLTISNGNAISDGTYGTMMNGGGVYLWGGIVSNCLITCNVASNGGGIYMPQTRYGTTPATLVDSTISGNSAYPPTNVQWQGGGGVRIDSGAVIRCLISNNWLIANIPGAADDRQAGGGIFAFGEGFVSNCLIVNNVNSNGSGGGAYLHGGAGMTNSTIRGNSARRGGGIFGYASGEIRYCLVEDNAATNEGGGVKISASGNMRNCLVRNNTAWCIGAAIAGYASGGGGILCYISSAKEGKIESCTIVSNYSAGRGGGIYFFKYDYITYTSRVFNSICYFNTAADGSNYYHYWNQYLYYSNNCTAPNISALGGGNIAVDPQFISKDTGDFRLCPNSPCINAGTNQSWMTNSADLIGTRRIVNAVVDMGAYEFLPAGTMFMSR